MCTLTLAVNIHSGFKLSRICPRFAVLSAILFVCGQGDGGGIPAGVRVRLVSTRHCVVLRIIMTLCE